MQFDNLSICFDLDGTLVDTAPDLVRVLNLVIAEDGLEPTDYTSARNQVGLGALKLIREAFKRANRAITENREQELLDLFLKLYEEDIAQLSQPFAGVISTLQILKRQGAHLSVCTNKPGYLARPLISALNMDNYFDRVVGSRDGYASKPSPELVFAAAGHRRNDDIIMVGDSTPDILAAKAARVPGILVTYGYANMPWARMRAEKVLRQFSELPAALLSIRA